MSESLFRRKAANAVERRWFSPVLVTTPPSALPTAAIALAAVAGLMLAAVVIEIPERVRAVGVLLPSEGLLKVRATRSGWVDELSVDNGSIVESGQALLWLTDAQHAPESQPETSERIASLKSEMTLLEQSLLHEIAVIDAGQASALRRMQLLEQRLLAARAGHATRSRQAELQNSRAIRVATLAADGLLALQSADQVAAESLQARALQQTAWQRVLTLQEELILLEQQTQQDAATPESLRVQTNIRREVILRDIAESELRSAVEITAPIDGTVAGLTVRAGSFVQSGQVIMTLHDPADRLEARLYISADNAAMIHAGQHVELQLRAYPHELFGTHTAIVTSVSAIALPAHEVPLNPPAQGPVFEIRAALASATISARGDQWQLPPGTALTADLIRRRWPLYRWLLRTNV